MEESSELIEARSALEEAVVQAKVAEEISRSKQIEQWKKSSKTKDLPTTELEQELSKASHTESNDAENVTVSVFVDFFLDDIRESRGIVAQKEKLVDDVIAKAGEEKLSNIRQAIPDYATLSDSASPSEQLQQCVKLLESMMICQRRTEERVIATEERVIATEERVIATEERIMALERQCSDMWATQFELSRAKDAGFTCSQARSAGYSASEMKSAGYSASEMKSVGCSASEVKTAGCSASELKSVGYSATELRSGGYSATELRSAGYSLGQMRLGGCGYFEIRDLNYSLGELKSAGYSRSDLTAYFGYDSLEAMYK